MENGTRILKNCTKCAVSMSLCFLFVFVFADVNINSKEKEKRKFYVECEDIIKEASDFLV